MSERALQIAFLTFLSLIQAFKIYSNLTGKAKPDAVVLNALFWDVGRLTELNRQMDWTIGENGERIPPR